MVSIWTLFYAQNHVLSEGFWLLFARKFSTQPQNLEDLILNRWCGSSFSYWLQGFQLSLVYLRIIILLFKFSKWRTLSKLWCTIIVSGLDIFSQYVISSGSNLLYAKIRCNLIFYDLVFYCSKKNCDSISLKLLRSHHRNKTDSVPF